LLEADVPGIVRDRLFDCITAPNFDQVLSQPNFITGTPDELLRFKEGDLFGFLLKLNAEQEKFVTWAISATGPTLLKGGPGTGKSTVALYRTREILQQLKGNTASPRILFTTYTNALVSFSEQLLQQLLGEDAQFVEVKTADALPYSLLCSTTGQPQIISTDDLLKLIKFAIPSTIATLEGNLLQQQTQRLLLQKLSPNY
jgi:superfamily I DNA/RNA helicase